MADKQPTGEVKTIVVPKALEDFFANRLNARYAERRDVRVVIDRRETDRRDGGPEETDLERRIADRRVLAGWWSLPDMPFETSA